MAYNNGRQYSRFAPWPGCPGDITEIFKERRPGDTASSWALRYVGTFPNVKVILSGMSTIFCRIYRIYVKIRKYTVKITFLQKAF